MSLATTIWSRALLTYSILTLPSLLLPPVYFISLAIAFVCSLPGLCLLSYSFWLLDKLLPVRARRFGWPAALGIALAAGCLSMQLGLLAGEKLIESDTTAEFKLLAFGLAVACVLISYLFSIKRIRLQFQTPAL